MLCDPRINIGAPIPNEMSELVVNRTHSAGSPTFNCVLFVSGYSTELVRIHPLIVNRGHIRILCSTPHRDSRSKTCEARSIDATRRRYIE